MRCCIQCLLRAFLLDQGKLRVVSNTIAPFHDMPRRFDVIHSDIDNPPWRAVLADNLQRLRQERGLSVRELAAMAKMYWIELERYENAEQIPSVARVYSLARCLEVSLHDLLPESAGEPVEEEDVYEGEEE